MIFTEVVNREHVLYKSLLVLSICQPPSPFSHSLTFSLSLSLTVHLPTLPLSPSLCHPHSSPSLLLPFSSVPPITLHHLQPPTPCLTSKAFFMSMRSGLEFALRANLLMSPRLMNWSFSRTRNSLLNHLQKNLMSEVCVVG